MPHVKELYDKYAKDGLVIIGVHTPRLDYEKEIPRSRKLWRKRASSIRLSGTTSRHLVGLSLQHLAQPLRRRPERCDPAQPFGNGPYEDTEAVVKRLLTKKNGISRRKHVVVCVLCAFCGYSAPCSNELFLN